MPRASDPTGTPRTRTLAAALRLTRERAGWSVRELARRLGVSHTAVSQWETGKRVPRLEDVSAILATLGVIGRAREDLLDLVRPAPDPHWLTKTFTGVNGFGEFERTATEIIEWSPMVIPGMVQTRDYTRAIFASHHTLPPAEVEKIIAQRLARRNVVASSGGAYSAFIGEWGLRQRVGSSSTYVEQVGHLLEAARDIPLRIVPIGDGWFPGLAGPFVLFRFADRPSIVFTEHHRCSAFLYDEQVSADYEDAAADLLARSLSRSDSVDLIRAVRDAALAESRATP